jgi:hypothetical protein
MPRAARGRWSQSGAALVRRDPELVVAEVFREPRIDGGATQRAAGVPRPMPADEDER